MFYFVLYFACFVFFVTYKRESEWTDRAQISHGLRKDAKNIKRLSLKVFDFRKIFKIHEKIVNPQKNYIFYQRENAEKSRNN